MCDLTLSTCFFVAWHFKQIPQIIKCLTLWYLKYFIKGINLQETSGSQNELISKVNLVKCRYVRTALVNRQTSDKGRQLPLHWVVNFVSIKAKYFILFDMFFYILKFFQLSFQLIRKTRVNVIT